MIVREKGVVEQTILRTTAPYVQIQCKIHTIEDKLLDSRNYGLAVKSENL